ncbi:MAG: L-serine ammonia-lyase, iron-sulfur-dependent, subunit alpha [Eubacteriales bacterium]|nr:L-serine ammonia-lyase, iron-sulfur-dependent, subunit alpha [Eubacteriales bacterium]
MYSTGIDILKECEALNKPIWEIVLLDEIKNNHISETDIFNKMEEILQIMENATSHSIDKRVETLGGIIGGEGKTMMAYANSDKTISGTWITKAMARAFACSEYNASMGKICAAPTAGSCGIIPAAIITIAEKKGLSRQDMIRGLLTSAGVGKIISTNATVSGAEGGCQAECGSAAAMAAAALVEMNGGSPVQSFDAAAIALKNIMGLICDPVAGLVESPCSKRNASGVVNAIISADIALSGIRSIIPFDEVVEAMYNVGRGMHENFKETAKGGISITDTGLAYSRKIK